MGEARGSRTARIITHVHFTGTGTRTAAGRTATRAIDDLVHVASFSRASS